MTTAGTLVIGGEFEVKRIGFGAMRLSGPGIWGDPPTAPPPAACCSARWHSA